MTEALEDARHLLAAGLCAPFLVDLRYLAGCVSIFNDVDFGLRIGHNLRPRLKCNWKRLAYLYPPKQRLMKRLNSFGEMPLKHQVLISNFASDPLATEIFEQWDRVFS